MRLTKPHLDIGMFTNDIAAHRRFWSKQLGLRFDHKLELSDNWEQHRYDAHDSVVKVNHLRDPLAPDPRSGYVRLSIRSDRDAGWSGTTPDGDSVELVAPNQHGIVGIAITVASPDPPKMMDFYVNTMEFEALDEHTARCGDSLLFVETGPGGYEGTDFRGAGFRYLTVQIFDADESCAAIVARGGRLGQAPVSFRDVARYGFVCDPDGNWIEISARASLIGANSARRQNET